jgi:Cys-tRNA(Pro)/Cys-tRNA(Cys) deacylase
LQLEDYLKSMGVWYRFVPKRETVHTADASKVTGIELERITKNLVCRTSEGSYALLIVPGNRRVDLQKAAQVLKARNVKLLGFGEAESVSGYPPGATPSVYLKMPMRVVLDKRLMEFENIFCGGGSRNLLLELKKDDVIMLDNATVAEITE